MLSNFAFSIWGIPLLSQFPLTHMLWNTQVFLIQYLKPKDVITRIFHIFLHGNSVKVINSLYTFFDVITFCNYHDKQKVVLNWYQGNCLVRVLSVTIELWKECFGKSMRIQEARPKKAKSFPLYCCVVFLDPRLNTHI